MPRGEVAGLEGGQDCLRTPPACKGAEEGNQFRGEGAVRGSGACSLQSSHQALSSEAGLPAGYKADLGFVTSQNPLKLPSRAGVQDLSGGDRVFPEMLAWVPRALRPRVSETLQITL